MKLLLFFFSLVTIGLAQDNSWMLYDDSEVAIIKITTSPEVIDFLYQNTDSDSMHYASIHFQNAFIDETVDSVGFRLRGNTSRSSNKKSFKLNFDYFMDGREFYGVDKMNLNGEHNDPSIVRAKLAWDFFNEAGVIASRAAHAAAYINEVYYGLYISVEHYDKEFLKKNYDDPNGNLWKCLWPADLDIRGSGLPEDYDPVLTGNRGYDLKTNRAENDFNKLAEIIDFINNSSDFQFANQITKKLDMISVIKVMAWDVLLGMWDDHWSNVNNFYLYHEPKQDLFHFIPYDYDNTMSIDWFDIDWASENIYNWPRLNDRPRALIDRILNNPQYRNLYSHFIQFYSQNVFSLELWDNKLDSLYNKIESYALQDTFRTLDYQFTADDFTNSYSESFENQHVKRGIRDYVNVRNQSVAEQVNYMSANPIIYNYNIYPENPIAGDSIKIAASIFSHLGLSTVRMVYSVNELEAIWGDFSANPVMETKKVEENDNWVFILPPVVAGSNIKLNILATDEDGGSQVFPPLNSISINIPGSGNDNLVINEFLAQNISVNADENGHFEDWIELYNSGDSMIDISGYYLSDSKSNLTKWQFPDSTPVVGAGEFSLIWCDEDQSQGLLHTNFKLSSLGEFISLVAPDGVTIIDSLSFGQQSANLSIGRTPDGTDNWSSLTPSPNQRNIISSIENESGLPKQFKFVTYPNPFNNSVTIKYLLQTTSEVSIKIYNILGKKIWEKKVHNNKDGEHSISWDGKTNLGEFVSSGLYIIQLIENNNIETSRITLIK